MQLNEQPFMVRTLAAGNTGEAYHEDWGCKSQYSLRAKLKKFAAKKYL